MCVYIYIYIYICMCIYIYIIYIYIYKYLNPKDQKLKPGTPYKLKPLARTLSSFVLPTSSYQADSMLTAAHVLQCSSFIGAVHNIGPKP